MSSYIQNPPGFGFVFGFPRYTRNLSVIILVLLLSLVLIEFHCPVDSFKVHEFENEEEGDLNNYVNNPVVLYPPHNQPPLSYSDPNQHQNQHQYQSYPQSHSHSHYEDPYSSSYTQQQHSYAPTEQDHVQEGEVTKFSGIHSFLGSFIIIRELIFLATIPLWVFAYDICRTFLQLPSLYAPAIRNLTHSLPQAFPSLPTSLLPTG